LYNKVTYFERRDEMKKSIINQDGMTLLELLASVTILSIILLSFLKFFIQGYHFTNLNQKKTVGVNVARNVLMYMEKESFIAMRNEFEGVNKGEVKPENQYLRVVVCNDSYKYFRPNETIPAFCQPITINNLPYKVFVYSEKADPEENVNYFIPITVEVRWEINGNEFHTDVDGTIQSEDIR
jgi:prepilin-type N-terminal cleavage/methylation domain-containing protein